MPPIDPNPEDVPRIEFAHLVKAEKSANHDYLSFVCNEAGLCALAEKLESMRELGLTKGSFTFTNAGGDGRNVTMEFRVLVKKRKK
jgi:hypothetical protein